MQAVNDLVPPDLDGLQESLLADALHQQSELPGVNGLKIRARGLMEKLSGFSMVCSPSFIGSIDCEPTAGRQDFSSGASWFGGGISHQVAFICRFRGGAVLVRPPVP